MAVRANLLKKIKTKNYLMKNILILIIFIIPSLVMSQEESKKKVDGESGATGYNSKEKVFKGSVNGKIIDINTNQPLSYANVTITDIKTNKSIEGTITSENGKFMFEEIETGKYNLIISFIGYKTKEIEFELTKKDPDYRFKRIKLDPSNTKIEEVEINETKAVYENKIDKIVYNPQNDVLQTSDDATDVLRRTPLLSVDLEGNVSLRGSSNIKFLINGKTSAFFSSDISTALQLIPADEIKSIEVITTPGAKYEGEGDAGIVNIVTNKKIIDGYQATINGSIGTKVNRNSLNLTLGKGRFGLSAKGGAHYSWKRDGENYSISKNWKDTIINGITITDTSTTIRNGGNQNQWIGYNGGINMFYDINAYKSITSNIYFGGRNTPTSNNTTNIQYTSTENPDENYEYDALSESNRESMWIEWNTDFTKKFASNEEKQLSIALQISGEFRDDDNYIKGVYLNPETEIHNFNNLDGIEHTFQIDYTHPFGENKSSINQSTQKDRRMMLGSRHGGKNMKGTNNTGNNKIETGIKIINRDQRFQYHTSSSNILFAMPEEIFNYNQLVAASYISSQWNLPKNFGIVLGGRYELTKINGYWENKDGIENEYANFLPNFVLSKKFGPMKSVKLSYNKRIRRPSSYYINPNTNIEDPKNITIGNPYLEPSKTDQVELGYNNFGIIQSSFYIYAKKTTDLISDSSWGVLDSLYTTYLNFEEQIRYGFNYYGGITLKKISLRGGFNISSSTIKDGDIERSSMMYNYNFGGTIDLGRGIKFESWMFARSPKQSLQGSSTSFSMMSFGIKKEFNNKRGSLGIRVIEPFLKEGKKTWITDLEGPGFSEYNESTVLFRSIGISFKYTFGKLNFKNRKTNSKIKNDDLQKMESQQE